jgi:hypothetical protein
LVFPTIAEYLLSHTEVHAHDRFYKAGGATEQILLYLLRLPGAAAPPAEV